MKKLSSLRGAFFTTRSAMLPSVILSSRRRSLHRRHRRHGLDAAHVDLVELLDETQDRIQLALVFLDLVLLDPDAGKAADALHGSGVDGHGELRFGRDLAAQRPMRQTIFIDRAHQTSSAKPNSSATSPVPFSRSRRPASTFSTWARHRQGDEPEREKVQCANGSLRRKRYDDRVPRPAPRRLRRRPEQDERCLSGPVKDSPRSERHGRPRPPPVPSTRAVDRLGCQRSGSMSCSRAHSSKPIRPGEQFLPSHARMVLRIDNQYIAADVNPQRRTAEPSEFHDRRQCAARETVSKFSARLETKSSHMHVKNVADGRRYVARDRPFPASRLPAAATGREVGPCRRS